MNDIQYMYIEIADVADAETPAETLQSQSCVRTTMIILICKHERTARSAGRRYRPTSNSCV